MTLNHIDNPDTEITRDRILSMIRLLDGFGPKMSLELLTNLDFKLTDSPWAKITVNEAHMAAIVLRRLDAMMLKDRHVTESMAAEGYG